MKDIISFSVPGSMAIYELPVGSTLIRFMAFDLEFFAEQCVELYKKSRGSGGNDTLAKAMALKEYLRNCHPYCAATLKTEFDKVALDCIIDHICQTEKVGLETLWVRYLTSKEPFEKAVFERITDYKSGFAINQWTNLMRMRTYARSKAAVIYGDDVADMAAHRARSLYYDMSFRVAAQKLGFGSDDLPQVRYYNLPLLPEAPQLLRNAANTLEEAMKPLLSKLEKIGPIKGRRDCVRDQMAGLALAAIRDIKKPDDFELRQFMQMYRLMPEAVFEPVGLKAIIDLEFDQLMQRGLYLKPNGTTYTCEKYSNKKSAPEEEPLPVQTAPDTGLPTSPEMPVPPTLPPPPAAVKKRSRGRPKGSVKAKKEAPAPGDEAPGAEDRAEFTALPDMIHPLPPPLVARPQKPQEETADDDAAWRSGTVDTIIRMAEDPNRASSKKRTMQEINNRCNLIWTSMNVRMGLSISPEEASAWSRYLTKLRYAIGMGELEPEALDKFLDATLEVYDILPQDA
jgi:hypothetical protein